MSEPNEGMAMLGAGVAFLAMTAVGIMIFGAITMFVLGLFGISVTFGQACGIGFVLGLLWGMASGGGR